MSLQVHVRVVDLKYIQVVDSRSDTTTTNNSDKVMTESPQQQQIATRSQKVV